ncbi:transglutaminase-like superfamily protein [Collimonas arenae]|uniref:Transglutaminase-like superfamily protein n=1 Tax=Collimonas arenae TaxID=279058 RepID=A0A127PV42_9BURK|nr:transglutaminase family protein [Collimonas arenae]AMP01681.1 transglutaminase-like superfamily protein [Collimonas arenae]AMP11577.1 transglutaminase-like superfamily protein [Collimonas arenae]
MSEHVYHIRHDTHYAYSLPVRLSHQMLRLTPRSLPWQTCTSHGITITPEPQQLRMFLDSFGNPLQSFSLESDHNDLRALAESWVTLTPRQLPQTTLPWEQVRETLSYQAGRFLLPDDLEASRYLFESAHVRIKREFLAYAAESFTPGLPLLAGIEALMTRIFREFTFDPLATTVSTPVTEVFATQRGVCQDFAHFMLSCLRSLGLAARYVSGYLLTEPPPGQARLIGADASHAWVSVYCPGSNGEGNSWIDADPTNGIFPDTSHITLGWGRDFLDVSPLRGVLIGGGQQTMDVAVTVLPGHEAPGFGFAV